MSPNAMYQGGVVIIKNIFRCFRCLEAKEALYLVSLFMSIINVYSVMDVELVNINVNNWHLIRTLQ